ncbi:hypothetical protein PMAYCL1PPCAC_29171, partial [Pristionchus mayeri]
IIPVNLLNLSNLSTVPNSSYTMSLVYTLVLNSFSSRMIRLRWISLLILPFVSAEIPDLESIPRPLMPTSCHMVSCMPGMVCRMIEEAPCKSPPCDPQPTCVDGESNEETMMEGEGTLMDPVVDKLGEHSTSPEEPMRRNGPLSSLSSNWTRGGSAPLLDAETTKLMEGAREKLMRAVMNQQPSAVSVGEFVIDLICLIRGTCQCNGNERYVTCGGCEGSCDNPTPMCSSGCHPSRCECLPGFVRFSSVCIPSHDCPSVPLPPGGRPSWPWPGPRPRPPGGPSNPSHRCDNNEEWDDCGQQCEGTCSERTTDACPLRCGGRGGCRCRLDYVRHSNGRCIPPNWCPSTTTTTTTRAPNVCPPNQRFMLCGTHCEATCNPIGIGCGVSVGCAPPRCECIPGYVRWKRECIPAGSCPSPTTSSPTCPPNQVFVQCSSPCEPSCYNPTQNCGSQCYAPSCQCSPGYYRRPAPFNDCVSWSQCGLRREEKPEECRENEEFKECTSQCEVTCFERKKTCPSSSCGPPGCECKQGFLRISVHESVCIPPKMCPARKTIWRRG